MSKEEKQLKIEGSAAPGAPSKTANPQFEPPIEESSERIQKSHLDPANLPIGENAKSGKRVNT